MAKVLLSGGLSQYTGGIDGVEIDAPRVQELTEALVARFPALADHIGHFAVAVDGVIYNEAPYHRLERDSEVCFVPRVAGGWAGPGRPPPRTK